MSEDSYKAIVARVKNVQKHPNADRLQIATVLGNQVIVGLDVVEDQLGMYFPTDGQLSIEFAEYNDLVRRKEVQIVIDHGVEKQVEVSAGGMFDNNRRVRTQKLRGEKSDGFWCDLSLFRGPFDLGPIYLIPEGLEFNKVMNTPLCNKYEAPATKEKRGNVSGKTSKINSLMFKEHFDTPHLMKNTKNIPENEMLIITEKVHGTSQRVGHVLVNRKLKWWEIALARLGVQLKTKEWTYLNGTRRVVLQPSDNSGWHSRSLRDKAAEPFINKLHKGETVYFEVVGYDNDSPIMGSVDIRKVKDKAFEKRYVKVNIDTPNDTAKYNMIFSYGTERGSFRIFVYRITMTNEDGISVDLPHSDVVVRCAELGVETVPVLTKISRDHLLAKLTDGPEINSEDALMKLINILSDGPSTIDDRHIKEGVVVRIESGLDLKLYKHKAFEFKVLEGIIKDEGQADTEEAS